MSNIEAINTLLEMLEEKKAWVKEHEEYLKHWVDKYTKAEQEIKDLNADVVHLCNQRDAWIDRYQAVSKAKSKWQEQADKLAEENDELKEVIAKLQVRLIEKENISCDWGKDNINSCKWDSKLQHENKALAKELESTKKALQAYKELDSDAAQYVESTIVLRTHFTGEPPYVGWRGLGLALNEAFDERDELEHRLSKLDQ